MKSLLPLPIFIHTEKLRLSSWNGFASPQSAHSGYYYYYYETPALPVHSYQSSFIISVAHCRLDFTINSRKNTSAMLNVNTTKITIVDETRECLSRQMMLTYSV